MYCHRGRIYLRATASCRRYRRLIKTRLDAMINRIPRRHVLCASLSSLSCSRLLIRPDTLARVRRRSQQRSFLRICIGISRTGMSAEPGKDYRKQLAICDSARLRMQLNSALAYIELQQLCVTDHIQYVPISRVSSRNQ